jgi:hypothetical protein
LAVGGALLEGARWHKGAASKGRASSRSGSSW